MEHLRRLFTRLRQETFVATSEIDIFHISPEGVSIHDFQGKRVLIIKHLDSGFTDTLRANVDETYVQNRAVRVWEILVEQGSEDDPLPKFALTIHMILRNDLAENEQTRRS